MKGVFKFRAEHWIVKSTIIRVSTLGEFVEALRKVDPNAIFYHVYANIFFNCGESTSFFNNSFAYWLYKNNCLELAEKISAIDPIEYPDLEELRRVFLKVLEEDPCVGTDRVMSPFYFLSVEREVVDYGLVARNFKEFVEIFRNSSVNSVFYHSIAFRVDSKMPLNEYSLWLSSIGENKKADLINKLDIYSMNLYEVKSEIVNILEEGR
ncbi:MAG: DUF5752 family protein [Thermosulfidibacteraceae bacterium]|jgi:hypothetical protein